MSVNDVPADVTRAGPSASRSTTRRCATAASSRASRSPSTTSCASPSSSTGSASTSSRRAGPAPTRRTTSSSAARRSELRSTRAPWSRSAPPAGSRGRSTPTTRCANLLAAGTSTVCIVGKSWDYHVLEALQTTLDEGVAMVADSVEFLRGRRARRDVRRRALLRRLQAQPRVRLRVLEGAAEAGATRLVLCDTNGGTLPHEVEQHRARRSSTYFGSDVGRRRPPPRRRRHRRRQRARRRARRARCRCRARSTATASAPATATSPRSSRTSR